MSDTITEFFARNPLDKSYTDDELDAKIAQLRELRKQRMASTKVAKREAKTAKARAQIDLDFGAVKP